MGRLRKISEGRLRYVARRCEYAATDRCECRCGGALHGRKHSEQWIKGTLEEDHAQDFYAERFAQHAAGQLELFT